jgi:iron(III) transport system substrate-binding protein
MDAKILDGLDEELRMPKAWIEGAKKEGAVKILASWDADQFRILASPFRERYPFAKISFTRAGRYDRGVKSFIALKAGRVMADLITSPGGDWVKFKEFGGLANLKVLPNFARLPAQNREPDGWWAGQKIAYRCIAYNTKLVKKSQMPKRWEDLLSNPFWRKGNLAMPNRPNLWLSMLWLKKGPAWTTDFMKRIFDEVKPQLRKEGSSATIALTVAGELPATVAAAAYRVTQYASKGAPIAWHCPEPVPLAISLVMMIKKSKVPNSAYLFLNWYLSKEGQLAQFAADSSIPVHKAFYQNPRFLPYPKEIIGKAVAIRDEERMRTEYPKLMAVYDPLWQGHSGEKIITVKAKIKAVKRGGRRIEFEVKGKTHTASISGRRTPVFVNGAQTKRRSIKPGMICEIVYPGDKGEAKRVSCKK